MTKKDIEAVLRQEIDAEASIYQALNGRPHATAIVTGIPQAAARLEQMSLPKWYKPAEQLPEIGLRIWFVLSEADEPVRFGTSIEYQEWNTPKKRIFKTDGGAWFGMSDVTHWMPVVKPSPPQL